MTPSQLAFELSIDPKRLRGWLRVNYPRPAHMKYSAWMLSPEIANAARAYFGGRGNGPRRGPLPAPSVVTVLTPGSRIRGAGNGLHHEVLGLASEAGLNLQLGTAVSGLTTRGHAEEGIGDRVPLAVLEVLQEIFDALRGDRGALASKRGVSITPDLVHLGTGTLVEVDEVQHFTTARLTSLRLYPSAVPLGFDREEYFALVETWRGRGDRAFAHKTATEFPGDGGRQRQRAYLDSVRDLLAPYLTGHPVVRIAAPDRSLGAAMAILKNRLLPLG